MLVRDFAIAVACAPIFFAFPAKTLAETNIVTCVLERAESDFTGTCEVPCSVNALAIDINGPNPKKACDSPPRRAHIGFGLKRVPVDRQCEAVQRTARAA